MPYINLNFGEQEAYPKIDLFKPDEKNIEQIISAVEKLGPQGLKVKADEVRSLIGLSNPEEGDETIGGVSAGQGFSAFSDDLNAERVAHNAEMIAHNAKKVALNAAENPEEPGGDDLDYQNESGFIAVSVVIERAAGAAADFESFKKELTELVTGWAPDKIAECIAVAAFGARAQGSAGVGK